MKHPKRGLDIILLRHIQQAAPVAGLGGVMPEQERTGRIRRQAPTGLYKLSVEVGGFFFKASISD